MNSISVLADKWWLVMIRGLALLVLGLAFVLWPDKSILVITAFTGLLLLFDGLVNAMIGLFSSSLRGHRWPSLIQGFLGIFFGLVIFNWPKVTIGFLLFMIAAWALVMGIITITTAIAARREAYGNWLFAALGMLAIVISLVIFANPQGSVIFLSVIYGVTTFVSGIFVVALSQDLRKINADLKR